MALPDMAVAASPTARAVMGLTVLLRPGADTVVQAEDQRVALGQQPVVAVVAVVVALLLSGKGETYEKSPYIPK